MKSNIVSDMKRQSDST